MRVFGIAAWLALVACSSGSLVIATLDDTSGPDPRATDGSAATNDAASDAATCELPAPSRHFPFDGVGTELVDVAGGPSGKAVGGATLDGNGALHLDGKTGYADLPNDLIAGLDEVTIALWIRYFSRPAYTRLFDFGSSSIGEDPPRDQTYGGQTYLALTPATGFVPSGLAVLMSANGPANETAAPTATVLEREEMRLVVVVVARETLSLFYGAELVTRVPLVVPLSAIVGQNLWLGRSQYDSDPFVEGDYADLRIWPRALPDCAVRAIAIAGDGASRSRQ